MTRAQQSLSDAYFEDMYRENRDPWRFASSPYEQEKYATTLAALGDRRWRRACEIGCSIGVLTQTLAARCERLVATEVSETALTQAKERCAKEKNVEFLKLRAPDEWPPGRFDLFVVSEVLYYFCEPDVERFARLCAASLEPNGAALLVHWIGETDYPLSADVAVQSFRETCGVEMKPIIEQRNQFYRLDLFQRSAAP